MPTVRSDKNGQNNSKKTKTIKMKRTTMIKATTIETTGMGLSQEFLHRSTRRVGILKVKSQASGYSWGCVTKKLKRKHPLRSSEKIWVTKFQGP